MLMLDGRYYEITTGPGDEISALEVRIEDNIEPVSLDGWRLCEWMGDHLSQGSVLFNDNEYVSSEIRPWDESRWTENTMDKIIARASRAMNPNDEADLVVVDPSNHCRYLLRRHKRVNPITLEVVTQFTIFYIRKPAFPDTSEAIIL